jgi:hypothetical protein
MAETFEIDAPRVTRDEATELCVHHMMLAATYFEATPDDDNTSIICEIVRAVKRSEDDARAQLYTDFARALWKFHEAQKERD